LPSRTILDNEEHLALPTPIPLQKYQNNKMIPLTRTSGFVLNVLYKTAPSLVTCLMRTKLNGKATACCKYYPRMCRIARSSVVPTAI